MQELEIEKAQADYQIARKTKVLEHSQHQATIDKELAKTKALFEIHLKRLDREDERKTLEHNNAIAIADLETKKKMELEKHTHELEQKMQNLKFKQEQATRTHKKNMKLAEIEAKRLEAKQAQLESQFNSAMSAYTKELADMRDQEKEFQQKARNGSFRTIENIPPKIENGVVVVGRVKYTWTMNK